MKRIYSTAILKEGSTYELEEKYYIHLIRVIRLKVGDQILLYNEINGEWLSKISSISHKKVTAVTIKQNKLPNYDLPIDLLFSPIKNLNSESIIRQATEMGVRKLFPTLFNRTVVKKVNKEKFETYAVGASQQCGRFSIPPIGNFLKISDQKSLLSEKIVLFFDEKLTGKNTHQVAKEVLSKNDKPDLLVVIGPEGGFTDDERQLIKQNSKSFFDIQLGPRILKADTAVVAALSLVFSFFS
jgi:16S rRNA (uracil1498-N3)-methyltransferase